MRGDGHLQSQEIFHLQDICGPDHSPDTFAVLFYAPGLGRASVDLLDQLVLALGGAEAKGNFGTIDYAVILAEQQAA